jgi:hypothetical protein
MTYYRVLPRIAGVPTFSQPNNAILHYFIVRFKTLSFLAVGAIANRQGRGRTLDLPSGEKIVVFESYRRD